MSRSDSGNGPMSRGGWCRSSCLCDEAEPALAADFAAGDAQERGAVFEGWVGAFADLDGSVGGRDDGGADCG